MGVPVLASDPERQAAWQDNILVFAKAIGEPGCAWPIAQVRHYCRPFRAEGTLTVRHRRYCLRHSHASVLIGAGVPLVVVQRRLGHSTIATTADVYGHIAPDLQERAAALFDGAFKVSVPLPADTGRPALPAS